MSIKIPIETSARRLHISQEDFEKLFGEGSKPHFIKELSQPGQYLCQERVTVKAVSYTHLDAVYVVVKAPAARDPCTAPAAPASDCISAVSYTHLKLTRFTIVVHPPKKI